MRRGSGRGGGFTLIELMIVVSIIGLLAAVAIPKFGDILTRSKESTAKGALGTFRSALDIYYVANQGTFPMDTAVLVTGGFIGFLPETSIPPIVAQGNPGHAQNGRVQNYADKSLFGTVNEGGNMWAYVNDGTEQGHVGFNCVHKNRDGSVWSKE